MIYENQCRDCSEIYLTTRTVADRWKNIVCPNCGSRNYQRIISVPKLVRSNDHSPPSGYNEYKPKHMEVRKRPDAEVKALKEDTKKQVAERYKKKERGEL